MLLFYTFVYVFLQKQHKKTHNDETILLKTCPRAHT